MENVMVLGKKVFYIPAVNERSLEKKSEKKLLSNNENSFEMKRHWSQSEEDIQRERKVFKDILNDEIKKGA
jgi:hypothetical protein